MPARSGSALREFGAGAGALGQGLRLWITSPALMLLGAVPALVVAAVFVVLYVLLLAALPAIGAALTPFASGWDEAWRSLARSVAAVLVAIAGAVLAVLAYVAVTLAVGDPFYERIARRVEERLGGAPPERREPVLSALRRAVGEGVRLLAAGALLSLLLFLIGLIPVVGWALALVAGAVLGGRQLAVELTGYAFGARGIGLRERRRALAARGARTRGFGAVTYLMLLVPPIAVVTMPAAVAGATVLARDVLGEERRPRPE